MSIKSSRGKLRDITAANNRHGRGPHIEHSGEAHHDPEGIDLEGIDLVRFTFELDEVVSETCEVVPIIVGTQARNSVSNLGARSPSGVRMTRVRIWWRR